MEYEDQPNICLWKITNSLAILRLRKPLKTSTRLPGHGIWTWDLPNVSLVRYHGATSLSNYKYCNCSMVYSSFIIRVFCPRAGPSLQAQKPRLQFYPKAGLLLQTQEPRLQFYQGWIGVVASHCFLHPTLSVTSEQTLKDLKRSQGHQRVGEESGFG